MAGARLTRRKPAVEAGEEASSTGRDGLAIRGDRLRVGGSVLLNARLGTPDGNNPPRRDRFLARGGVSLKGAAIEGDLNCEGGCFVAAAAPARQAIVAYGARVGGSVLMGRGFWACGEVALQGVRIGSNLACDGGARFCNKEGQALTAKRAHVSGNVRLTEFTAKGDVVFDGATVGNDLLASGEVIGSVSLVGAELGGDLELAGKACLHLKPSSTQKDRVALNADFVRIRGSLLGGGVPAVDVHSQGGAPNASSNGERRLSASGTISLRGAHIGGSLVLTNAKLCNREKTALTANGAKIGGSLALVSNAPGRFESEGTISLVATQIEANLRCTGGTFKKGRGGIVVNAEGIRVGGYVLVGLDYIARTQQNPPKGGEQTKPARPTEAEGSVILDAATIGGDLKCESAKFTAPAEGEQGPIAISVRKSRIGGSVNMGSQFMCKGRVLLEGARVDGDVTFERATFLPSQANGGSQNRYGVDLQDADVPGTFHWYPERLGESQDQGENRAFGLDLRRAKVGTFCVQASGHDEKQTKASGHDEKRAGAGQDGDWLNRWPDGGNLKLGDYTYGAVIGIESQRERPLKWLERSQDKLARFNPQPYQQLARVLRAQGHESLAKEIGYEAQKKMHAWSNLKEHGCLRRLYLWAGNQLLRWTVGHGYYPFRVFWWLGPSWLLLSCLFWLVQPQAKPSPAPAEKMAKPSPARAQEIMTRKLILVPLLPQREPPEQTKAAPGASPLKLQGSFEVDPDKHFHPLVYALETLLPVPGISETEYWRPNARVGGWGFLLYYLRVGFTCLGWVLTGVFLAAVTGVIKRE